LSYRGRSQGSYGNIRKLQRVHARRSSRAKKTDESLRAPIAKTPEQWLRQPNRFDIPDVDTPKQSAKQQEEKHQENVKFEPKSLTHSQIKQRLAHHRLYGVTH
jgi:hypothetical protein